MLHMCTDSHEHSLLDDAINIISQISGPSAWRKGSNSLFMLLG